MSHQPPDSEGLQAVPQSPRSLSGSEQKQVVPGGSPQVIPVDSPKYFNGATLPDEPGSRGYSAMESKIDDTAPKRRICGLSPKWFWTLAVALLVIIIAAAVGGGVGGSLASKKSSKR
jgi:hypothetical protein